MNNRTEVQKTFEYLADEILNRRAVLFVGSGFSTNAEPRPGRNARMMNWDQLKERVIEQMEHDPEKRKELRAINTPRLLQIFEKQDESRYRKDKLIREAIPDDDVEPSDLHRALVPIGWSAIVTTNIDTLIERSFNKPRDFSRVVYEYDMPHIYTTPVYKIHGDYRDAATWVFTEEEYNTKVKPLFIDKLRTIFAEKTVVFVGYSIKDPDLEKIMYYVRERLEKFHLPAFLVSKEINPSTEPYWNKRNITLITEKEIKLLDRENSTLSEISEREFISLFINELNNALNRVSDEKTTAKSLQTTWLWKQTRLIPAIRENGAKEWDFFLKGNQRLLRPHLRIPYRELYKTTENLAQEEEWRRFVVDYCNSIITLSELKQQSEFLAYTIEFDELLFELKNETTTPGYCILHLLPIALHAGMSDPAIMEQVKKVFRLFLDALWNRYNNGYLHGLLDYDLDYTLNLLELFLADPENTRHPFLTNYWHELRWIRLISGNDMAEPNLDRMISFYLNRFPIPDRPKALLLFRQSISWIYQNQWQKIDRLIQESDRIAHWNESWTAFLLYEIGKPKKAYEIYNKRIQSNAALKERFLAGQSRAIIESGDESLPSRYSSTSLNRDQENLEKIEETKERAAAEGIRLNDFDFLNERKEDFRSRLYKKGVDDAIREMEKMEVKKFSFRNDSVIQRIHDEYWLHALNGVPSANLQEADVRKALQLILNQPRHIESIFEIQNILPVFQDYRDERISEKVATLAWTAPRHWARLQKSLLLQYERLIQAIQSMDLNEEEKDRHPLILRFHMLAALQSQVSQFLSSASRISSYSLLIIIIENWRSFYRAGENFQSSNLERSIQSLFESAEVVERANFLNKLPVHLLFSIRGSILKSIDEYLNSELWMSLSDTRKQELIVNLKKRIPNQPSDCFPFLLFARGDKEHPFLAIFESGIEEYRIKRKRDLEEQIQNLSEKMENTDEFYRRTLEEELTGLNTGRHYFIQKYGDYLSDLDVPEPEPELTLEEWISDFERKLSQPISSSALESLLPYVRSGTVGDEIHRLNELFERLQDQIEKKGSVGLGFDWRDRLLDPLGIYYIATNQFDRWINLWERFNTFYGKFAREEQTKSIRRIEEEEPVAPNLSERLFYLYLNTSNNEEKTDIIDFLYWLVQEMEKVQEFDIRLLNHFWRDRFVRTRYIYFLVVFTMKIVDIEEARISSFIPGYLSIVTGTEEIWMDPHRAHFLSQFLTRTEKYWKDDENLAKRVQNVRETLQILDFPPVDR